METIVIKKLSRDFKHERFIREMKKLDWQNEFLTDCLKVMIVFTVVHIWIRFLLWAFN